MSSDDHLEYYRERARQERELEAATNHPKAASIHATLADVYEALVANGQRPTARVLKPDFRKRAAAGGNKSGRSGAMEREA